MVKENLNRGLSLIEVLVSLALLSFMLLGLDAIQLTALKATKSAYYFSVANQQLQVMAARLAVLKNADNTSAVISWNQQNKEVLPQGRGNVSGAYPVFDLTIFWGAAMTQNCVHNQIGPAGCLHLLLSL